MGVKTKVAALTAKGKSPKQIARKLDVSEKLVEKVARKVKRRA
jgi:DNA-binding CsgD family transcriptional regulator